MSIELVLEGKVEGEDKKKAFIHFIEHLAKHYYLKIENFEEALQFEVCPEGYIDLSFENDFVSIIAQTNVAGPGFHAYVAKIYDEIVEESGIEFSVGDETNYYFDRDFDKLKEEHFYGWLHNVAQHVVDREDELRNFCISWPLYYYRPIEKENCVVTPMGYISFDSFENLELSQLADLFFIWNNEEKDAMYYKNCALNLIWKECYFEYSNMNEASSKFANEIIDLIEVANEMDNDLPLPMAIYRQLCEVMDRDVLIQDAIDDECDRIGYRRHNVYYSLGNWRILAQGTCEKDVDETNGSLVFIAPFKENDDTWSYVIRASAFSFNKDIESFMESFEEENENILERFTFEKDKMKVKGNVSKFEDYYTIEAQLNHGKEMLLVSISIINLEMKDQMIELIHKIQNETFVDDKLKS